MPRAKNAPTTVEQREMKSFMLENIKTVSRTIVSNFMENIEKSTLAYKL